MSEESKSRPEACCEGAEPSKQVSCCSSKDQDVSACCPGSNRGESTCCGSSPAKLWKLLLWVVLIVAAIATITHAVNSGKDEDNAGGANETEAVENAE